MITKMFSLYDSKAKMFGLPFCFPNVGMAQRALYDLVRDESTMVSRHPDDFILYQIAEFDDSNAVMVAKVPLELVAQAADYSKRVPPVVVDKNISKVEVMENEISNES